MVGESAPPPRDPARSWRQSWRLAALTGPALTALLAWLTWPTTPISTGSLIVGVVLWLVLGALLGLLAWSVGDAVAARITHAEQAWNARTQRMLDALEKLNRPLGADKPVDLGSSAVEGRKPASRPAPLLSEMLARLQAARSAGDAEEVLAVREQLTQFGDAPGLTAIDQELAGWFTMHFQRELRAGRGPVLVDVMTRVVALLADRADIHHLEQALPIVRRTAGLCPSCGQPYQGSGIECPVCQAKRRESGALSNGASSQTDAATDRGRDMWGEVDAEEDL